jgi:hypothetical protein
MGIAKPKPGPGGRISYEQRWAYVIALSVRALGISESQLRAALGIVGDSFLMRLRALVQDSRWADFKCSPTTLRDGRSIYRDLEFADFYLDNVELAVVEFVDELVDLFARGAARMTPQQAKAIVALAVRLGNRLRDPDWSFPWLFLMVGISVSQPPSRRLTMVHQTDHIFDNGRMVSLEEFGSSRAHTQQFNKKLRFGGLVERMELAAARRLNLRHVLISTPVDLHLSRNPFKKAVRKVMQDNVGAKQAEICAKVDDLFRRGGMRTMIPESWSEAGAKDMLSAFKHPRLHKAVKTFLSKIAPEAMV